MKKFIATLALALVPVLLWGALFVAFEPNNYFGLRPGTAGNAPIARLRAFAQDPQPNIILGDSRMAHFDMELVNEVSGERWANVSYGGASLEESIDEFYYLYQTYPGLKKVVLGVSFYTLNANYRTANRMATIETQLKNPAAYMFNLEYNINTLTALSDRLANRPDVEETAEHTAAEYTENGVTLPFRRGLIDYAATLYANCAASSTLPAASYDAKGSLVNAAALADAMQSVTPASSKFAINETALQSLLQMAAFCRDNGIELTLVLPPMQQSVRELVCAPLGIDDAMRPALQALAGSGASVLDYEWANDPAYPDTAYYDGFHLDTVHGLPLWTRTLFTEVG